MKNRTEVYSYRHYPTKRLNFIEILFIFTCLFPSVSFISIPLDSTPYAVFLSVMIIALNRQKKIRVVLPLILLFLFSSLLLFFSKITYYSLRSLYVYFSLLTISWSFLLLSRKYPNLKDLLNTATEYAIIIYFVTGLLQATVFPEFGSRLTFRGDNLSTFGRGVSGLGPEPTTYGYYCILLLCIILICSPSIKRKAIYSSLLLIQILFFARSSGSVFVIAVAIIMFFLYDSLSRRRFKAVFLSLAVTSLILFVFPPLVNNLLPGTRLSVLTNSIADNPMNVLLSDQSVNERFLSAFLPVYASINSYFLPNGFDAFTDYVKTLPYDRSINWLINDYFYLNKNRGIIMSGFGAVIFETGIIGVYFLMSPLLTKIKLHRAGIFALITFLVLLFNAISFSNALLALVYGLFMISNTRNPSNKIQKGGYER